MVKLRLFFCKDYGFFRADDVLFTLGLILTQFFSHNAPAKMSGRSRRGQKAQSKTSVPVSYIVEPAKIPGKEQKKKDQIIRL